MSWDCSQEKNDLRFVHDAMKNGDMPMDKPKKSTETKSLEEEVETPRVKKPVKVLAPVKSIVLEVVGPDKAEVTALKQ